MRIVYVLCASLQFYATLNAIVYQSIQMPNAEYERWEYTYKLFTHFNRKFIVYSVAKMMVATAVPKNST